MLHIAVMLCYAVEKRWPRYFCKLGRLNHMGWQGKEKGNAKGREERQKDEKIGET